MIMSKTSLTIFGLFIAVIAVVVFLAFVKEGSEEAAAVPVASADEEAQEMFATNCGSCHTLAAGGTDGVVGPNLDTILARSVSPPTGTPEEIAEANKTTFEATYAQVLNAVTCGLSGRMPAGILEGEEAQQVAGFVAAYAGQLGEDQGALVPANERQLAQPQPCASEGGAAPSAESG
jgi:mono/diheme cytochrome c family protein